MLAAALGACDAPSPFFSLFQEADGGNHKYFQIFNPTDAAVDLAAEYSIAACGNGCAEEGSFEYGMTFAEGASIAAGGTYTVCNSGLGNTSGCDEVLSYPDVSFNGDDFQALIRGTDHAAAGAEDIVDQIGLFSVDDPGSSWPVCGGDSGMETRNGLMVRDPATCCGDSSGAAFADPFEGACEWTEEADHDQTAVSAWASSASCAASAPPSPPQVAPPPDVPNEVTLACPPGCTHAALRKLLFGSFPPTSLPGCEYPCMPL